MKKVKILLTVQCLRSYSQQSFSPPATVDDLPWWWAYPGNINTIDLAGLPPGPHKILITLVDARRLVKLFPCLLN